MACTVTYLKHSGFSVRTPRHRLLFDYIGGDFARDGDAPVIALASHVHEDHYDPAIRGLADVCVLGEGIEPFAGAFTMRPGDSLEVEAPGSGPSAPRTAASASTCASTA